MGGSLPPAGEGGRPGSVRVGMIGLGCAKNLIDGEIMLGHLARTGVEVTSDPTRADIVVVNTCGFITAAKEESIEAILEVAEAKRAGTVQRLVVAGCMAQAYADELAAEIPEIDTFVGLDELEHIVEAVRGELVHHIPHQRGALRIYGSSSPRLLSTGGYAYLKVAEGCNNPCAFCHIPAMRGEFRSRPTEDLIREARNLRRNGVQELVLVAQDTTRYGEDLGMKGGLTQLVQRLLKETDIPWIRFLYAYPSTLDERLLELMAAHERFVPYLDLPLQHASRTVLKAMRRGGDARSYRSLIERARATVPGLAVRTTFIVGFPGEGETEVAELEEFIREVRFDHLGIFEYSWQEENPGSELGDPIPESVKAERRERLMAVQQGIALEKNRVLVGQLLPAIVSGPLEEMEILTEGRLQRQAPETDGRLIINDGTAAPATLVEVEVTEAHPYDLIARLVRVTDPAPNVVPTLPVVATGA
ncbi:MAG: 30S ribosomal protein S12 methylthiotransferase RimO [Acidobacteria bacterium]|jgi:ribosomal protein S12 methylthiotransferase|nr:30S ribosomal protein S12 methylthiotransferase RimO [Acidobacteriota bacterium]